MLANGSLPLQASDLAEDMRERWETSDSPIVHRIQVRVNTSSQNTSIFGCREIFVSVQFRLMSCCSSLLFVLSLLLLLLLLLQSVVNVAPVMTMAREVTGRDLPS
jgi:hypothetical protein